ncbi:MAG: hypothetical protein A2901_08340 [Elusimicrobia bacterium RIFCSPLOWO2_01_FULL_54_10]|nr:MAG: hypothetical protein A2901_08340 [Elusimicrobia bacterium RIFCSPLOWO2_01_FULL_54_10]
MRVMKTFLPFLALCLFYGCAAPQKYAFYQYTELEGVKSKTLDRLKWENSVQPGEDISKALILEMDNASSHLIQIRGSEKRHSHDLHDLTVILQSGRGRMFMGNSSVSVGPGAVIFIPRGLAHYFVNGSAEPASAIAIYSPAFDGKDVVDRE